MQITSNYISKTGQFANYSKKINGNSNIPLQNYARPVFTSYPANYYVSFGARVKKDLESFYIRNKETMPETVKSYIENLPYICRE